MMIRINNGFIVKVVALTALLFLIAIIRLMASLNTDTYLAIDAQDDFTNFISFKATCFNNISIIQHEIEMLQDQIRVLQSEIFEEHQKHSHMDESGKHFQKNYLDDLNFKEKLARSDASHGQSYPSERHVPTYTRFDMWHLYYVQSGTGEKVADKLNGLQRRHIDEVIDKAVLMLNDTSWRRDHFIEGVYHTAETIGTHYELHFVNDKLKRKKVTLFRPQALAVPLRHSSLPDYREQLNVVIPLHQRSEAFKLFLTNFEVILGKLNHRIHLTIVYFGDTVKDLMKIFQPFLLKHSYRSYHIEHITDSRFSRGLALDAGIRRWKGKGNPLFFLCDVDVIFNEKFIQRCQSYTDRGHQVYYPIVFSLYNPKVIQLYLGQKFNSLRDRLKVSPEYGFWRSFGYGMACFYRSDYLENGGFDLNLEEWGEEDILLFRRFSQSNLTVIRAPDPDIFHLWHNKTCNTTLSDLHYRQCTNSKVLNEGSHAQLGYLVLHDELKRPN